MKRSLVIICSIALILIQLCQIPGIARINSSNPVSVQAQLASIGILTFQDESATNVPPELGQRIAQDLQQKLTMTYKDVLPRIISAGAGASSHKDMAVEQLAALGKQNGVKFIVRGGLLALTSEKAGNEARITAQLYAEIVSVETSAINSARAEGSGANKANSSKAVRLSSIDFKSSEFRSSALGQALSNAIEQLAASIHEVIASPASDNSASGKQSQDASVANETNNQADASQSEDAAAAEADEELAQLMAQAEALLSNSATTSTESLTALGQALKGLKSALASKATLLEEAKDTAQSDQEIAARKQELQTALAAVTEEMSTATPVTEAEQPSGEKKNKLAIINEYLGEAVSMLQKIQEIRAMFSSAKQEPPYESSTPSETGTGVPNETAAEAPAGEQTAPVEEPLGEASGTVTENGNPVEDGTVTDAESGATAPIGRDGTFMLNNVIAGKLLKLIVTRAGKQVAMGKVFVPRGRSVVADFDLKQKPDGAIAGALKVIPPTVIVDASKARTDNVGLLRGVVLNADGKPVTRALVHLDGLAMARTDSQGRYAFLNVPPGVYQLTVKHSELKPRTEQVRVAAKKINESKIQFASGDRSSRQTLKQPLIVREAGGILRGRVLDSNNRPVSGARITVIQASGALFVYSRPTGAYEFKSLKPGPYRMAVSRLGFESLAQSLTLRASGIEQRDFRLAVKSSPLIERVLEARRAGRVRDANRDNRIKPQMTNRGQLNGSIFDAQSRRPISGATISLQGLQSIKSDREGRYALANLLPGSYQLQVGIEGYRWQKKTILIREGSSTREDFLLGREGGSKEQGEDKTRPVITVAPKSGHVRGQITDAKTGKPVPGASMLIEGRSSAVTTSHGLYALSNLPQGTYSLSIRRSGYSDAKAVVMIRAGETVTANFKLNPKPTTSTRSNVLRFPR